MDRIAIETVNQPLISNPLLIRPQEKDMAAELLLPPTSADAANKKVLEDSRDGFKDDDDDDGGLGDVEEGDDEGASEPVLQNEYLDSLEQLEKNKVAIDQLTRQLSVLELETTSIVSELDALETKMSPILSQHVVSYQTNSLSYPEEEERDEEKQSKCNDTAATCTCTLSKTRTPDRNDAKQEDEARLAPRRGNLSDFQCECVRGDMESVSGLFPGSDLSSISKCQSTERVSVNHNTLDEVEVVIERRDSSPTEESNGNDLLQSKRECGADPFMISTSNCNDSLVSALSANDDDEDRNADDAVVPKANSTDHAVLDTVVLTSDDGSTEIRSRFSSAFDVNSANTYEKTGRKSHLYEFPEDLCCLLHEPSLDLTIPAAAEANDDDEIPCFPLGIHINRNRPNDDDECGCVIT